VRFMPAMPARKAQTMGRVMVVPSRAESFPYVVLETAAAGKPMIATRVGGIPEIFGTLSDALVPADDVNALAAAIARTLDDPGAAEALAQRLRTSVAGAFTVRTMVDGVMAAYQTALQAAHPAGERR
ncbi:MAG: glycosyltransferase family 4 protein, partial [Pseudolabrys sp.]